MENSSALSGLLSSLLLSAGLSQLASRFDPLSAATSDVEARAEIGPSVPTDLPCTYCQTDNQAVRH